jgi:hypothetical protein
LEKSEDPGKLQNNSYTPIRERPRVSNEGRRLLHNRMYYSLVVYFFFKN